MNKDILEKAITTTSTASAPGTLHGGKSDPKHPDIFS